MSVWSVVSQLVPFLHAIAMLGMVFFSLHRARMLWLYVVRPRRAVGAAGGEGLPGREAPLVCIQCPLYNEPAMVESLLESVTAIEWPAGRLEVQVLDDSTDGTTAQVRSWLEANPERAAMVRHVRRAERKGFKAGALAEGLERTDAEFVAIFDADFRPGREFLRRLMPEFRNPRVGLVQGRWEFANQGATFLTRLQVVLLDAHFFIEQPARSAHGLYVNFNGTAGIWRRRALEEAGGWTADTVTEDLDISYRAQLKGWRFVYRGDCEVPSELPENPTAFKSQVRRWTKGGMQVARKLLPRILAAPLPWRVKSEAFFHLSINAVHGFLLLFAATLVPFLLLPQGNQGPWWTALQGAVLVLAGGSAVGYYAGAQWLRHRRVLPVVVVVLLSPAIMAFGLALSVALALASIEGFLRHGGEFVRTPKGGGKRLERGLVAGVRARAVYVMIAGAEWLLSALMAAGAVVLGLRGELLASVSLGMNAVAFASLAGWSSTDLVAFVFGIRRRMAAA